MKIGILTQPLRTNYGGLLQAWALQNVLRTLGHSPITVDRHYDVKQTVARRIAGKAKRTLHDALLETQGKALYCHHLAQIRANQTRFIDAHIDCSTPIGTDSALRTFFSERQFDVIVVGSDQVWRPKYSPRLETYYLDFAKNLTGERPVLISYAASFGVDTWEYTQQQTKICHNLIQQFDGVSVREKSAVDLCRDHLGVEAQWVLDPTLLIEKEKYVSEFCTGAVGQSKGVLTYILDKSSFKKEIISSVANRLKLEHFSRQPLPEQPVVERTRLAEYCYPPTDAWVRGFQEGQFVVTDSFHGVVLSLIFEKPFIAIANADRGASRFESILDLVGLRDRLILSDQEVDLERLLQPVDFSDARKRLQFFKTKSLDFLKQHL